MRRAIPISHERYLAGALDARTGQVYWVAGLRKTSALFLSLLHRSLQIYAQATVIHVILDNYRIHDSKLVQAALRGWGVRIQLHFLPPSWPTKSQSREP